MTRRVADQRGLAAPFVVSLAALVLALTVLAGGLGRLLVDQRRASTAADLAALAGAGAVQRGQEACAVAAGIAQRNRAELTSCTVTGAQVRVRAAVELTGMSGLLLLLDSRSVEAEALAGPVP